MIMAWDSWWPLLWKKKQTIWGIILSPQNADYHLLIWLKLWNSTGKCDSKLQSASLCHCRLSRYLPHLSVMLHSTIYMYCQNIARYLTPKQSVTNQISFHTFWENHMTVNTIIVDKTQTPFFWFLSETGKTGTWKSFNNTNSSLY